MLSVPVYRIKSVTVCIKLIIFPISLPLCSYYTWSGFFLLSTFKIPFILSTKSSNSLKVEVVYDLSFSASRTTLELLKANPGSLLKNTNVPCLVHTISPTAKLHLIYFLIHFADQRYFGFIKQSNPYWVLTLHSPKIARKYPLDLETIVITFPAEIGYSPNTFKPLKCLVNYMPIRYFFRPATSLKNTHPLSWTSLVP